MLDVECCQIRPSCPSVCSVGNNELVARSYELGAISYQLILDVERCFRNQCKLMIKLIPIAGVLTTDCTDTQGYPNETTPSFRYAFAERSGIAERFRFEAAFQTTPCRLSDRLDA